MPTRCNRGFYCRYYCLLDTFRASLCPSSGAQEYYTVVAACGISCCGFSSSWSGVELRSMRPVCRMLQHPANRTHNYVDLSVITNTQCASTYGIIITATKNFCDTPGGQRTCFVSFSFRYSSESHLLSPTKQNLLPSPRPPQQ